MVFSFQSQPMAWTLNGSSASTQGGFLIIQQKSSKNFSFPVAKIVRMRSMCQFCWSWSPGFALVYVYYPLHHQSFCQLKCAYFATSNIHRSLTATFSGKIEFSVVSTNGEKVFRKKKSIKVGKRRGQC